MSSALREFEIIVRIGDGDGSWPRVAGGALVVTAATLDGLCSALRLALGDAVKTAVRVHSVFDEETEEWVPVDSLEAVPSQAKLKIEPLPETTLPLAISEEEYERRVRVSLRESPACAHMPDRPKRTCKECGGSSLCLHGREKSKFKDCGGSSIGLW